MDDILKEFFGDEDNKEIEVNASEVEETPQPEPEQKPLYEDVYSSIVKEQSQPEPAQYEQPQYEPPRQEFTPPEPTAFNQPYTAPYTAENSGSNKATFYQPPVTNNAYNAPPVFNAQNPYAQNQPGVSPELQPKKKKSKAPWIIALIIILCICVAGAGIKSAVDNYKANPSSSSEDSSSSNPLEDFLKENDESNNTNASNDAQASVKSSDEAAKKDSKGNFTVAGVAAENKESCVGITVYTQQQSYDYFNYYGSNQQNGGEVASGEGSGVIMSESNGKTYIMTCAHVIEGGSSFTVTLDNDKTYDAKLVGADSQTDIGVLVIEAKGLKIAEFGDSDDIEVGEDCVAIGCPGGLQFKNSVTKGIVSALDVPVSSSIGYDNECIQVDAAINPGNSGGALFNMQGQVIGINSSKIASTDYEGMGFAVPSNTAVATANALIKDGYVKGRAKLGISYNTLSSYSSQRSILSALEEKGFKDAQGTMVIREISSDSDLNGKVQEYDMIVAVNGETMTSVDVLTSVLAKSEPGDTVKLTIARINNNNQINTFEVKCTLIESKE